MTESVPENEKKSDRTPFAALLLRHPGNRAIVIAESLARVIASDSNR